MKKAKCCICGKEIVRDLYPDTPKSLGGKPFEIQICGNKTCKMKAWYRLRRKIGVAEYKFEYENWRCKQ